MTSLERWSRRLLIVFFFSAIFCLTACTRSVETSKVKIQLPKAKTSSTKSVNKFTSKSNTSSSDEVPPWNVSLNPGTIDEINCYAVFVEGPELKQNSCSMSDGSFKVEFGDDSFAGFFPAGAVITLEVPSGDGRIVHLAGAVAQNSACRPQTLETGAEPDFENLSMPQIIASSAPLTLSGGETSVELEAKLNSNQFFDNCDFVEFNDDDGSTPPGPPATPPTPTKPAIFLTTNVTNDLTTPTELSPASLFDFDWIAPIVESESFTFQGDSLSVNNSGDYFMAWNYSIQSAAQRNISSIDLRIDGIPVPFASTSGGYLRGLAGFEESSMNMAAGLSLSSFEEIKLSVQQFHQDTGGSTNGLANLYLEPLPAGRNVFMATGTQLTTGTNLNPSSQSPVEWASLRKNSAYTHSDVTNPEQVTITQGGRYLFTFNAPITSTVVRAAPQLQVTVDGTGINAFTAANCYIRSNTSPGDTECLLSGSGFFTASAADIVKFELFQGAVAGTANVQTGKELSVYIEQIPDNGSFFAITQNTASGSDWNTASPTAVNWESTPHVDTSIYSHSTGTDPHQITVNQDGDYLVQFNAPMTATSNRVNLIVSILVNGVEQPGSQVKSFHVRNSSGHNDSSGSLFYLLEDLSSGDIIELQTLQEAGAGAITVVGSAQLSIVKKN